MYTVGRELLQKGILREDIYAPQRQCLINGQGFHEFPLAQIYLQVLDLSINKEHYYKAYNQLLDENSRKIFVALLRYRVFGKYELDKNLYAPDVTYFHSEHFKLGTNERFVDVGACTGDSIIDFLMKTDHQYDKIYAIEGNATFCSQLKEKLYMECEKGKIEVFNVGVGDQREVINYSGYRGGVGDEKLEIYPLDQLLENKEITLIKMDIEGMELQAIEGAERIIKEQKPKLAICIYHLLRDIWEIQEKISSFVPEYKFLIEQPVNVYMSETVLYAFVD